VNGGDYNFRDFRLSQIEWAALCVIQLPI
jgi:hypothetical protein